MPLLLLICWIFIKFIVITNCAPKVDKAYEGQLKSNDPNIVSKTAIDDGEISDGYLSDDSVLPNLRKSDMSHLYNDFDINLCKEFDGRILCGYDKNKGIRTENEPIYIGGGCRTVRDRIECGYWDKPVRYTNILGDRELTKTTARKSKPTNKIEDSTTSTISEIPDTTIQRSKLPKLVKAKRTKIFHYVEADKNTLIQQVQPGMSRITGIVTPLQHTNPSIEIKTKTPSSLLNRFEDFTHEENVHKRKTNTRPIFKLKLHDEAIQFLNVVDEKAKAESITSNSVKQSSKSLFASLLSPTASYLVKPTYLALTITSSDFTTTSLKGLLQSFTPSSSSQIKTQTNIFLTTIQFPKLNPLTKSILNSSFSYKLRSESSRANSALTRTIPKLVTTFKNKLLELFKSSSTAIPSLAINSSKNVSFFFKPNLSTTKAVPFHNTTKITSTLLTDKSPLIKTIIPIDNIKLLGKSSLENSKPNMSLSSTAPNYVFKLSNTLNWTSKIKIFPTRTPTDIVISPSKSISESLPNSTSNTKNTHSVTSTSNTVSTSSNNLSETSTIRNTVRFTDAAVWTTTNKPSYVKSPNKFIKSFSKSKLLKRAKERNSTAKFETVCIEKKDRIVCFDNKLI